MQNIVGSVVSLISSISPFKLSFLRPPERLLLLLLRLSLVSLEKPFLRSFRVSSPLIENEPKRNVLVQRDKANNASGRVAMQSSSQLRNLMVLRTSPHYASFTISRSGSEVQLSTRVSGTEPSVYVSGSTIGHDGLHGIRSSHEP